MVEVESEEDGLLKIKEEEMIKQIMTADDNGLNTIPD